MTVKQKFLAYVLWRNRLLAFEHVDYPEVGLQVPGGTISFDETPEKACLREVREESGLEVELVRLLGSYDEDMRPHKEELHRRHVFLLRPLVEPEESWIHYEEHADGVGPIAFRFFWAALDGTDLGLAVGQGRLLVELTDR